VHAKRGMTLLVSSWSSNKRVVCTRQSGDLSSSRRLHPGSLSP